MIKTAMISEGERRFRRLVEALDHAVVWEFDDSAQRYTFVSEHAVLVLGYPCEAWMSDPQFLERRVFADDQAKLATVLAKLRAGEAADLRLEHRCLKADGTVLWVHTGIHGEEEDGRLLLRGVTVDINNIKLAEQRERAAREQAEGAMRALEDVMAIVSHDLRNPLNTIVMGAGTIASDPALARKSAEIIARAAAQMSRLIDDLVEASIARDQRLTVAATEVSTHDLINDAIEALDAVAQLRGIELRAEESGAAIVRCDPKRVAQVLSNLLGNAIKFSPAGQTVTVSVMVDAHEALFAVADRGSGIAPSDLPKVFERSWQARETADLGRGLGLYIAKGIVDAHAGRIWAESVLGTGSTFHFTLPLT